MDLRQCPMVLVVGIKIEVAQFHINESVRGIQELSKPEDFDNVFMCTVTELSDCSDFISYWGFGLKEIEEFPRKHLKDQSGPGKELDPVL